MRLFISYDRDDKPVVMDWIVGMLRAAGHTVWIDENLQGGQVWEQELWRAIRESDALIFAMTPESVQSEWCRKEREAAASTSKPIVPVLLQRGTTIPAELAHLQYVDFTSGATREAIARLLGGLQHLPRSQAASVRDAPQQVSTPTTSKDADLSEPKSRWTQLERLAILILTLIGTIATVIAVLPLFQPDARPSTPIVTAQRNTSVLFAPAADAERIGIIPVNEYLDVVGISQDFRWYQVLLADGRTGWVTSATSEVVLSGSAATIPVVIPSRTPTDTPTVTAAATITPTSTNTETPVPTNSVTADPILETVTPNLTTNNVTPPSPTRIFPTATISLQSPCGAIVTNPNGPATIVNQVYIEPSSSAERGRSIRVGDTVVVHRRNVQNPANLVPDVWYLIYSSSGERLGWTSQQYLSLSANCPR